MDEHIEVVISHDILEVPTNDTTEYIWAATQIFTITYLPDKDEGAVPIDEAATTANGECHQFPDTSDQRLSRSSIYKDTTEKSAMPVTPLVLGRRSMDRCTTERSAMPMPPLVCFDAPKQISCYQNGKTKPNVRSNGDGVNVNTMALSEHFSMFDDNKTLFEPNTVSNGSTMKDDSNFTENKQTYDCSICEKVFVDNILMHTHRIKHFGYFDFKDRWKLCDICQGKFHDLVEFSDHLLFQHYQPPTSRKRKQQQSNFRVTCGNNLESPTTCSSNAVLSQLPPIDTPEPQRRLQGICNALLVSSPTAKSSMVSPASQILNESIFHQNFPTTNNDRLGISSYDQL